MTVYDESTAIEGGPDSMGEWRPRATPPIGVDLNNEQKLACAFRILARDASVKTWPATSPGPIGTTTAS